MQSDLATILTAAARGPMATGRVAGLCEGMHDVRTDQAMGGCWVVAGCGLGSRWRAAVSGDGPGYAVTTATRAGG